MKLVKFGLLSLLTVLALIGCGASAPTKIDAATLAGIDTIALISVSGPAEYTVINKGSLAAAGGAIGGAMIGAAAEADQPGLVGALSRNRFSFSEQLTADLKAALEARGYKVTVIQVPREKIGQPLKDFASISAGGAQAVLDVAVTNAGYATQHWMNSAFWRPEARVEVNLYSRPASKLVYEEAYMYGYHNPFMGAVDIDAPEQYRFANKELMDAASDDVLIGGLRDASLQIAAQIASKLAR